MARDRGQPPLNGTSRVTINIIDANNKDPFFQPSIQRADVYESKFSMIFGRSHVAREVVCFHIGTQAALQIKFLDQFAVSVAMIAIASLVQLSNIIQLLTGFEGNRWSVGPEDELLPEAEGRGQQFIWGANRSSVALKPRQQLFCYTPIFLNYVQWWTDRHQTKWSITQHKT